MKKPKEKIINTPWGKAVVILEENMITGKVKIMVSKKRYKQLLKGENQTP